MVQKIYQYVHNNTRIKLCNNLEDKFGLDWLEFTSKIPISQNFKSKILRRPESKWFSRCWKALGKGYKAQWLFKIELAVNYGGDR